MRKMIVTDFDDTVYDTTTDMPIESTISFLRDAREKGSRIAVLTGRLDSPENSEYIDAFFQIHCGFIPDDLVLRPSIKSVIRHKHDYIKELIADGERNITHLDDVLLYFLYEVPSNVNYVTLMVDDHYIQKITVAKHILEVYITNDGVETNLSTCKHLIFQGLDMEISQPTELCLSYLKELQRQNYVQIFYKK